MEMLPKLSPAQALLLRTAARRPDGRVIPPDTLRGGARAKVLTALLQRGWIEPMDSGNVLTDAGYEVIGQQRPLPPDDVQPMDTADDLQLLEGIPVRPGTKLAALVMALRRPQGEGPLHPLPCGDGRNRAARTVDAGHERTGSRLGGPATDQLPPRRKSLPG